MFKKIGIGIGIGIGIVTMIASVAIVALFTAGAPAGWLGTWNEGPAIYDNGNTTVNGSLTVASNLTVTGSLNATVTNFSGNGSAITNLTRTNITGLKFITLTNVVVNGVTGNVNTVSF